MPALEEATCADLTIARATVPLACSCRYVAELDEASERLLRDFYREPNERLFALIGRRFDHWVM